ncbi:hypothetical protein ACFX13_009119 [Malus domestica]|uniref:histone-lysine N-methyltransferase SUVR5-like n=1 Tax=Malus sylvestris TaxID=3752 RepID=UPI0021ACFF87|nr:histone-lysine N-methyltransferase SUVR5-like [Malus sylvestris]
MNDLVLLERERNIRPDPKIDAFMKSLQLGCVYACSLCYPETCDHVYHFDNDYYDAKDIYGKSMRCRFPYDQRGRLILEVLSLILEAITWCSTLNDLFLRKAWITFRHFPYTIGS